MLARGLLSASSLAPIKARILQQLLLMTNADKNQVAKAFSTIS
jgi:L-asparaginase